MRKKSINIRLQLNEQLRCLDVRVESQVSFIQELQDFFRRRGELEMDYSKSLDKLAKTLQMRHKEQKQKREQWPLFSSYACWQQLLNQTKSLSKDHATLSEIYSVHLVARLQAIIEDVQRIYKRCREIGYETHEEILRVLQELHTTMKTYHSYQADCKVAETKLRTAEAQRSKLEQSIQKEKLERSKKYRLTKNEVLKRKSKYTDARLKALKAKNEYQLCLEAANTTIHKYFVEDLSDLIDCMDLGFGSMISRAILMHVTADQGRCRAVLQNADVLSHIIQSMDSRADKQKFLEQHHGAFMIPKRIEFQGQVEEEIEPELQKTLHADMEQRLNLLNQRLSNLRAESEEIWKTLETAEITLLEHLNAKDYDTSGLFGDGTHVNQQTKMADISSKSKSEKQEIEEFYITKIREYILGTSRIARLDAKAELIRNALIKDSTEINDQIAKSNVPKRKRIGRINMSGQPKLFGGSLEEYLEATNEEIPLIMRSCIRVINLYGLHHQGIFRVSGSQVEISNFREGFERGEDPLADTTDASDINSVAGVLKLYLRELREPLFPIIYFDHFVSLAQLESKHEIVVGIKKFLQSLPRAVVIVIRYLFAFLHHLSEYSDENMMDAYNLAICFGPTLMPAPEDKDQVQYQNQVNELIKNMIVYHAELFPKDLGGLQYEKYISDEPFMDIDVGDSPSDHDQVVEDPDSEVYPSEDESDILEAIVQFDFKARSNRELSLRKGDTVVLRKQVSNDWWQGTIDGKEGLVPDKYISLKIKGEDQVKCSNSEESVRKRRPSGNIQAGNQLSIAKQQTVQQQQSLSTNETSVILPPGNDNHQFQHQQQQQQQAQQQMQQKQQLQQQQQQQQHQQYHLHHHGNEIHKSPSMVLLEDGNIPGVVSGSGVSHPTNLNNISQISNEDLLNEKFHQNTINNTAVNINNDKESTSSTTSTDLNSSIPTKYSYHDEIHSFENSMEFSEELSHFPFEVKKTANEPIYAEPNKVPQPIKKDSIDDQEQVEIRFSEHERPLFPQGRRSENVNMLHGASDDKSPSSEQIKLNRHSADSNLGCCSTSGSSSSSNSSNSSTSKDSNRNMFRLNRDLWEKRAESGLQGGSFSQSRILERTRDAPDLVMDLPLSDHKNAATRNSIDCLDMELLDELTSAERFASQNQCTLKKNERFSTSTDSSLHKSEEKLDTKIIEKPKAKVKPQQAESLDTSLGSEAVSVGNASVSAAIVEKIKHLEEVLHIDEGNAETSLFGPKELIQKSPIPTRNTQKYVSQFADLKLTGGCQPDTVSAGTSSLGVGIPTSFTKSLTTTASTPEPLQLSSFKPQVKVKPQILKKTFIRTPTTPEAKRKNMDIDQH